MSKAIAEIRGVDTRELQSRLAELRKEEFNLRFHGAQEQVARTSRHREIRRTVARILTVLGQRQTQDVKVQAGEPQAGKPQVGKPQVGKSQVGKQQAGGAT